MKKLALALALCGLTSLAHAGWFSNQNDIARACKTIGDDAVQAYQDSHSSAMQSVDPASRDWRSEATSMGAQDSSASNFDAALNYGVKYAYTRALSEQDAYTTGYSHCMDALN